MKTTMKMIFKFFLVALCASSMVAMGKPRTEIDEMFGFKLGDVMPRGGGKDLINNFSWIYRQLDCHPRQIFEDWENTDRFDYDYFLIATPVSRKILLIRALTRPGKGGVNKMKDLVWQFEEYLGIKPTVEKSMANEDIYAFDLSDGKKIHISMPCDDYVSVDLADLSLWDLAKSEVTQVKARKYAKEIRSLGIKPEKETIGSWLPRIDSVFGMPFGKTLPLDCLKISNLGSYVYPFSPRKPFMKCVGCQAFASNSGRRVFMIRAIFNVLSVETEGMQIKDCVEGATGYPLNDVEPAGVEDAGYFTRFGNVIIRLTMYRSGSGKGCGIRSHVCKYGEWAILDFIDISYISNGGTDLEVPTTKECPNHGKPQDYDKLLQSLL